MYERRDGAIYNTTSIINPEGEVIGRYSKMFPFTPLEQGVHAGQGLLRLGYRWRWPLRHSQLL